MLRGFEFGRFALYTRRVQVPPSCVFVQIGRDIGRWKPAIFVDAAMHAREWIAPSTAVFLINHVRARHT